MHAAGTAGGQALLLEPERVRPTTPLPAMAVNLFKNIVGSTMFSLAAGVARFSDSPGAVLPASVLTLTMGVLCAYTYTLVGRSCELTGTSTFREAWAKVVAEHTAWVVPLANILMSGASCLKYVVTLSYAGSSLATAGGVPAVLASRSAALLVVTCCCLLPLSLLEFCSQLRYTSVLGFCGVLYYTSAMLLRFMQGAYAPGGVYREIIDPARRPSFNATGGSFWSLNTLFLVSTLTTAYAAHHNAPKFYRELEDRSISRFRLLALLGFGMAATVYVVGLCSSFLTFGGASCGLVLNNYAATDDVMVVARVIVSFVILCTFPLQMAALRDGASDLLPGSGWKRQQGRRKLTLVLVALLACLGLAIKDVGALAAVPGAIFGSATVYLFPALVFLGATRPKQGQAQTLSIRLERAACSCIMFLGASFAVLGTGISLRLF